MNNLLKILGKYPIRYSSYEEGVELYHLLSRYTTVFPFEYSHALNWIVMHNAIIRADLKTASYVVGKYKELDFTTYLTINDVKKAIAKLDSETKPRRIRWYKNGKFK